MTRASAVMAPRRANPSYGVRTLYREAFTIGRDHLAATIAGCFALMAAVPITTGLASSILSKLPAEALSAGHGHHH